MEIERKATLNTLLSFVPATDEERQIFDVLPKDILTKNQNDVKSFVFRGNFYLGGQLKMKPDDEITLEKIEEVREISRRKEVEDGYYNSFEANSARYHNNSLSQMEDLVKAYNHIMSLRK